MVFHSTLRCSASIVIIAMMSSTAFAQSEERPVATTSSTGAASKSEPVNPGEEQSSSAISEIVVTAQRRQQSLQDVPIAVSAFSGDELESKQIDTTLDIARLVPNMVATGNVGVGSANTYFIRALGNTESIATFDPPVGTYIDDIYISRQNANNFSFFDVDRIEVLRGPQGSLFGRNTTGGAISIILKKPAETFGGYVEGSYGRFNSWSGKASVDIPVNGKLLTKFSAYTDNSDGFVNNLTTGDTLNGRRSYGFRGAVRYLPSERVTWDISSAYTRSNEANFPSTHIGGKYYSQSGLTKAGAPLDGIVAGEKMGFGVQNITKSFNVTSNIVIETGGPDISIISGYVHLIQDYLVDVFDGPFSTGGFALANQGRFEQFSQEIKVNGSLLDGSVDYVAGVFYIHEGNKTDFADVFTLPNGNDSIPLVLADRTLRNTTSAPAVYAQFDWHATSALTLTVGGRWTSERKSFSLQSNGNQLALANFDTGDILALGVPQSSTTQLFTPRIAAQYRFSSDMMVFASATRGFRSGGWNARATTADQFLDFGPEKVWSYEAGIRSELFDRRVRLNLTGFFTDVNGFQVPLAFVNDIGSLNFITQNGSDLRVYGLEAETTIVPTDGMSLFANIGLLNADYHNPAAAITTQQINCRNGDLAACGQGIVDPNGDLAEPQRAPHFTASFGGRYDFFLGDSFVLTPSVNARYTSRQTIGTAGTTGDKSPPEWLVGASLALVRDQWKLSLECANCFDNAVKGSYFPPAAFFWNAPRTWTARVRYDF